MEHAHSLESQQQQRLRARICPRCQWRPKGSESLGPDVPRPCQGQCPIFLSLPALVQIARNLDPMLTSYGATMHDKICRFCAGHPIWPGVCVKRAGHACPLCHYRKEVVETLRDLVRG
jgi:hypothetical protein